MLRGEPRQLFCELLGDVIELLLLARDARDVHLGGGELPAEHEHLRL